MPETGVYFVKPSSMAFFAASLICCGVSKSGSPAAQPIIGRPSALYLPALAVIARVGDSLIACTRTDKTEDGCDKMCFPRTEIANKYIADEINFKSLQMIE